MSSRAATLDRAAERIIRQMAFNREQFKDRVEEKLTGALLEHYKAAYALLAGQARWVEHWQNEARRLLEVELVIALLHTIKGFKDRRKAANEVVELVRAKDEAYQRAAAGVVRRDYGLAKLPRELPPAATADYYAKVMAVIEENT